MADQQYCLRWNNHQTTLVSIFDTLLQRDRFTDCTISAEGQSLAAHKILLTACSPYFEAVLSQIRYDRHPVIILKDVTFAELKALMDYMYRGEVNISQDQLAALLKVAESLQIKGLSDSGEKEKPEKRPPPLPQQPAPSVPRSSGLTVEHSRRSNQAQILDLPSDSPLNRHDGNVSPVPRKRKRPRRRSSGDDSSLGQVHPTSMTESLDSSNSREPIAASIPQNVSALLSKTAVIPEPRLHDHDLVLPDALANVDIPKIEPPTELDLLQPKEEYVDDNDDVDHITLDDDDDDMDLSQQAGPSHGGEGSSSQGYPPSWHQASDRSNDEVFMAAQEAVGGAQRDSQGSRGRRRRTPSAEDVKPNADGLYLCPRCDKPYKDKRNQKIHTMERCGKGQQYQCPNCHRRYTMKGHLDNHMRTKCGRDCYKDKRNQKIHTMERCGKGQQYQCPKCHRRYTMKGSMPVAVFVDVGSPSVRERFPCPLCGRTYKEKHNQLKHTRNHCGRGQQFQCPSCWKRYKIKSHLVHHLKHRCQGVVNIFNSLT